MGWFWLYTGMGYNFADWLNQDELLMEVHVYLEIVNFYEGVRFLVENFTSEEDQYAQIIRWKSMLDNNIEFSPKDLKKFSEISGGLNSPEQLADYVKNTSDQARERFFELMTPKILDLARKTAKGDTVDEIVQLTWVWLIKFLERPSASGTYPAPGNMPKDIGKLISDRMGARKIDAFRFSRNIVPPAFYVDPDKEKKKSPRRVTSDPEEGDLEGLIGQRQSNLSGKPGSHQTEFDPALMKMRQEDWEGLIDALKALYQQDPGSAKMIMKMYGIEPDPEDKKIRAGSSMGNVSYLQGDQPEWMKRFKDAGHGGKEGRAERIPSFLKSKSKKQLADEIGWSYDKLSKAEKAALERLRDYLLDPETGSVIDYSNVGVPQKRRGRPPKGGQV